MCALILLHRLLPEFPVVLAANRDEFYDRPAGPPELVDGRIRYVAPVDARARGTWIGTNAAGVTVAVTNRREAEQDASRPSRGHLVREALSYGSAAAVRAHVQRALAEREYNGFNLLYVDEHDAFCTRNDPTDGVSTEQITGGLHTVTNLHDLDELEIPAARTVASSAGGLTLLDTVSALAEVLKSCEPVIEGDDFSICKDHGHRGTRSSTVIARSEEGRRPGLFLHSDGPPNTTPYEDYAHLLRRLAR